MLYWTENNIAYRSINFLQIIITLIILEFNINFANFYTGMNSVEVAIDSWN